MNVLKSNGEKQEFDILKIRKQINFSCEGLDVNPLELESKISLGIKNNMKTSDIQQLILVTATTLITQDEPDWIKACGRLATHQLHREVYKNTKIDYTQFDEYVDYAVNNKYYRKDFLKLMDTKTIKNLSKLINYKHDFNLVLPQVLSLKSKYLIKNQRGTIEYPQFADMASAIILASIEPEETKKYKWAKEYFELLRDELISLATPFKANLRLEGGNTGSCFILNVPDNLEGITKSWSDMATISKEGGGIGVYLGMIRPGDSYTPNIPKANKVTRWVKIINDIAVAVNQRGIRKGAITPAIDWWHLDVHDFLQVKTETQTDLRDKSFDIFPQVIVDKYFVHKKKNNEDVYLFDQYEAKTKFNIDVCNLIGDELFNAHLEIERLILDGKFKHFKKVNTKELWKEMLETWIEIGDFYISHKDNINLSNYLSAHYIANSVNLCVESWSISKPGENWSSKFENSKQVTAESDGITHSCNLISINVGVIFDDKKLERACVGAVRMLDASIDTGTMPVIEAQNSSQYLRNIGIGTVGVADWMAWNKLSYTKDEDLKELEKLIEKIAWYCYNASIDLAIEKGSYPAFEDANYDKMFGKPVQILNDISPNGFDWVNLSDKIKTCGIRNFLINAIAPNTSSGIVMNATASYLPPHNKFNYQTLADLSVPIIPRYLKERHWYYKGKFQYGAHELIKATRSVQRWIDTGVSMEVLINPALTDIKQVSDMILEGFETEELKAVYYSLTIDGTKESGCTDCAN